MIIIRARITLGLDMGHLPRSLSTIGDLINLRAFRCWVLDAPLYSRLREEILRGCDL